MTPTLEVYVSMIPCYLYISELSIAICSSSSNTTRMTFEYNLLQSSENTAHLFVFIFGPVGLAAGGFWGLLSRTSSQNWAEQKPIGRANPHPHPPRSHTARLEPLHTATLASTPRFLAPRLVPLRSAERSGRPGAGEPLFLPGAPCVPAGPPSLTHTPPAAARRWKEGGNCQSRPAVLQLCQPRYKRAREALQMNGRRWKQAPRFQNTVLGRL